MVEIFSKLDSQPNQFKKTKSQMKIKEKKNMLFKGDLTHYISILTHCTNWECYYIRYILFVKY